MELNLIKINLLNGFAGLATIKIITKRASRASRTVTTRMCAAYRNLNLNCSTITAIYYQVKKIIIDRHNVTRKKQRKLGKIFCRNVKKSRDAVTPNFFFEKYNVSRKKRKTTYIQINKYKYIYIYNIIIFFILFFLTYTEILRTKLNLSFRK